VPWLTIEAALGETEKLLKEDSKNRELLSEVGDWLRTLTPLQKQADHSRLGEIDGLGL
jgi:hypothetical protein